MLAFGRHLLVELHDCDGALLNDLERVETAMRNAAVAAGATIVNSVFHRFSPQGVTGVVVIEESHLSLHTWPEHGYAAADFYTCGDCRPEAACQVLCEHLSPGRVETMTIHRGLEPPQSSIAVQAHAIFDPRSGPQVSTSPLPRT